MKNDSGICKSLWTWKHHDVQTADGLIKNLLIEQRRTHEENCFKPTNTNQDKYSITSSDQVSLSAQIFFLLVFWWFLVDVWSQNHMNDQHDSTIFISNTSTFDILANICLYDDQTVKCVCASLLTINDTWFELDLNALMLLDESWMMTSLFYIEMN